MVVNMEKSFTISLVDTSFLNYEYVCVRASACACALYVYTYLRKIIH